MKSHLHPPAAVLLGRVLALTLSLCCLLAIALPAQAHTAYEQELLDLINAERVRQGAVALEIDPLLQQCSRIRAQEITERFSHKRPDKTEWRTVFAQVGLEAPLHSENLAEGHETPKDAFDGWMQSKSHRENMLNPEYSKAGLASATGADGTTYYNLLLIP